MDAKVLTNDEMMDHLVDAILPHVTFDGWSETAFRVAVADCDVAPTVAKALCPRGAVDLAVAYHLRGDGLMLQRLKGADLTEMRFRDRIAAAVRFRLEAVSDREAVRRGATLFALPTYALDGAKAVWNTVDLIWDTLGDGSDDFNWYTKRATLAGVYSSTVLYWLGDDSDGYAQTWEFLDRRIDDVMQIEKVKAQAKDSAILKPLMAGPLWALSQIKAPLRGPSADLPGRVKVRR